MVTDGVPMQNAQKSRLRLVAGPCLSLCARRGCLLVLLVLQACHEASQPAPATTIILIDQARSSRDYQRRLDEELAEFTRQTGIRVEFLPAPETAEQQLAIWQKLLEGGPK